MARKTKTTREPEQESSRKRAAKKPATETQAVKTQTVKTQAVKTQTVKTQTVKTQTVETQAAGVQAVDAPVAGPCPQEPAPFDWRIDPALWPPNGVLRAPLSMTAVETARSCPLRLIFEQTVKTDRRYRRRTDFTGRLGTAVHRTIERLSDAGYTGKHVTPDIRPVIENVWQEELQAQRTLAALSPRDANRAEPEDRVSGCPGGIYSTLRLTPTGGLPRDIPPAGFRPPSSPKPNMNGPLKLPHGWTVLTEQPVRSADGLFAGIVDHAERTDTGVFLQDHKTTTRTEVPEKFRRQLQLYASMWKDTYGMPVTRATLNYPLIGAVHPVSLNRSEVETTLKDARAAAARVTRAGTSLAERTALGSPGSTCGICCWRPWCAPFWTWAGADSDPAEALSRSGAGWQGVLRLRSEEAGAQILRVEWSRGLIATLIVPVGLLTHLWNVLPGERLYVLDTALKGQVQHARAIATPTSEVMLGPEDGRPFASEDPA